MLKLKHFKRKSAEQKVELLRPVPREDAKKYFRDPSAFDAAERYTAAFLKKINIKRQSYKEGLIRLFGEKLSVIIYDGVYQSGLDFDLAKSENVIGEDDILAFVHAIMQLSHKMICKLLTEWGFNDFELIIVDDLKETIAGGKRVVQLDVYIEFEYVIR